jgi:Fe-S oxidoreductase
LEAKENRQTRDFSGLGVRDAFRQQLEAVSSTCINCELCKKECAFLHTYGNPKEIADGYDPGTSQGQQMPFECSLCGLCAAVCPFGVDPPAMFLEMRAEAVNRGKAPFPEHEGLIAYEKRGISKRYSYYALPAGCSKVLFPGCALPGTRPGQTLELLEQLRRWDPRLGIVLDCCTKISHDLGRESFFRSTFGEMRDFLVKHGVREVLVACSNCYKIFQAYGQDLKVRSVYEVLAELPVDRKEGTQVFVSVHDSCGMRGEEEVQVAVRKLVRDQGLDLIEMKHSGAKTLCCGEGGSVGRINPAFSKRWGEIRKGEAEERLLITSCAGCAGFLGTRTRTAHVLDLIYDLKSAVIGKAKVSKPPFTYLNRVRLKKRLKKSVDATITRERDLPTEQAGKKGALAKRLALLAVIIGAILAVRAFRGRVPLTFIIGLFFIILISMLPLVYRRYKAKRGEEEPI